MSEIAIQCEGLGKRYRIGERERYRTLREAIVRATKQVARKRNAEDFIWALDDVSFDLQAGEVLGVIGRNGAGKSTLLKILSRITKPTRGRALIHGRVGAFLEVGTGFHPELTGRENIYLNGAILGMRRREIARKFDEIVAFAETEKFLDTPVKRYSSGMYMRLAFSVAAHLEPEILLVDEVLAVGDAAFQKKCLGKMGDVAQGGRTVLLVSHNLTAVEGLCRKAIWLDKGRIASTGDATTVIRSYLRAMSTMVSERLWQEPAAGPGNNQVQLRRVAVKPAEGADMITVRTPVSIEIDYSTLVPALHCNLVLSLYNETGAHVFSAANESQTLASGTFRTICLIPGDLLNDGTHFVSVLLVKNDSQVILEQQHVLAFDVQDDGYMRGSWYGNWPGVIRPALQWTSESLR